MKHTYLIDIGKYHSLYEYCDRITVNARHLYNRSLFLLRNTMTGLNKDSSVRTVNEQTVLDTVESGIHMHNMHCNQQYDMPTVDKWFLSQYVLTSILHETMDADYNSLPGQVNQRIVSKCCNAMKGFFKALGSYKKNPSAFTGIPKLPDYLKSGRTTASFSNQTCRIKKMNGKQYLCFPKTHEMLCLGHHVYHGKLQSVEIKPYCNIYRICLTFEDEMPDVVYKLDNNRYYSLDLGVSNFAAVTGNFNMQPFILDGKFIKSINRLYNKKRSVKQSKLTKGIFESRAMRQDTIRRDRFLRDAFYKMAHFLCRKAISDDVNTIIYGWNTGIKDGSSIGAVNNQNFVQIPYLTFIHILKTVAGKYGISVCQQEESYTSKASFLDMDDIPVYGVNDTTEGSFSGRRITRSCYRSDNGTMIHADVNASLNILRKYRQDAFDRIKDISCFLKHPKRYNFLTFYP